MLGSRYKTRNESRRQNFEDEEGICWVCGGFKDELRVDIIKTHNIYACENLQNNRNLKSKTPCIAVPIMSALESQT